MNRHGRRFVELRDFKSHANSLNVRFLKDDELEFYEKHCLLLPAVVCRQPEPRQSPAHARVVPRC